MEILSLTQPVSEKEVIEMHVINQENIPEVGGLADINDFNARVCWSSNIFTYKYEDVIKAFVLCMREGRLTTHQTINTSQTNFRSFCMLIE